MPESQTESRAEIQNRRPPDAIIVPLSFARGASSRDRLHSLKSRLASLMGVGSISVFNQGTYYFVAPTPDQTMLYPADDPRHPGSRYEWRDRGEGVRFGYLTEGA